MRLRTAAFRLLVLSLAAACASPEPPASSARLDVLRVVDINVWSGLDYQGVLTMGEYETDARRDARYRALLAGLRALDPDVIGVHEANPIPRYVERLVRDLGYDAVMHTGLGGVRTGPVGLPWNLREGDAILARPELGLRDEGRRQLSGGAVGSFFSFHFRDATQVLAASIGVNGRRIHLLATHWHAGEEPADSAWRGREAERTVKFVEEVADTGLLVLMGDFNATPESPAVRRLLDAGFADLHGAARGREARPTWDPRRNRNIQEHYLELDPDTVRPAMVTERVWKGRTGAPKRIDLILARPVGRAAGGIRIRGARVVLDEPVAGVHASDHFGVMAELRIAPCPEGRWSARSPGLGRGHPSLVGECVGPERRDQEQDRTGREREGDASRGMNRVDGEVRSPR